MDVELCWLGWEMKGGRGARKEGSMGGGMCNEMGGIRRIEVEGAVWGCVVW